MKTWYDDHQKEWEKLKKTKEVSVESFNLPSGKLPQHTPTPWKIGPYPNEICLQDGDLVATTIAPNQQANTKFIVRAVNSHETLMKLALRHYTFQQIEEEIQAKVK